MGFKLPSIPYPPASGGYWEPVTSTINWCEEVSVRIISPTGTLNSVRIWIGSKLTFALPHRTTMQQSILQRSSIPSRISSSYTLESKACETALNMTMTVYFWWHLLDTYLWDLDLSYSIARWNVGLLEILRKTMRLTLRPQIPCNLLTNSQWSIQPVWCAMRPSLSHDLPFSVNCWDLDWHRWLYSLR